MDSTTRRAGIACAVTGLLGAAAALGLFVLPRSSYAPTTGVPLAAGSYTVTLTNDTYLDGTFEVFAYDDYTGTHQTLGAVASGESVTFTLASGGESYVFVGTAVMTDGVTSTLTPMISEDRLHELSFRVNFLDDDMGFDALPTEEQPVFVTPTMYVIPTPTPVATP